MKYFATTAALISVVPRIVALTINTPASVVQCQPELLSWRDGAPPFYLSIIPGGQASATPLKTFDTQSGTSLTWTVDIPAGTSITVALKDSTGATAFTDVVSIQKGTDSSCLNGSSSNTGNADTAVTTDGSSDAGATGAASTASGTASRAATSVAAGTATHAATTAVTTRALTGGTVTSAAGTTTSTRAASTNVSGAESRVNVGAYGVAGVLGLIGAMLL